MTTRVTIVNHGPQVIAAKEEPSGREIVLDPGRHGELYVHLAQNIAVREIDPVKSAPKTQ